MDISAKLLSIQRVKNLSPEDFDNLVLADKPVIIEDVVSSWSAFRTWSAEYLEQKIGGLDVSVRTSATHVHPDFDAMRAEWNRSFVTRVLRRLARRGDEAGERMLFRDFLQRLATSAEGFRYLAGAEELSLMDGGEWNPDLSVLRADFDVPGYVPLPRLDSAALWVSAKGVRSHLHYDGNSLHNLNAQIIGEKHVQLYSPAQMASVYPYLQTSGRPYTFSQVDVENVDHARFPLFSKLEGYEATLIAGDLLFIPAYWYHTFKHLGDFNVNVNFWWRAPFVRLTPVSARDYLGGMALDMLSSSKIPPFWMINWLQDFERRITRKS